MQLNPRYEGPPLLHVDEAFGNPSVPMLRQRRRLVDELMRLDAEQWRTSSRCDGWSVQDVVAHLASTNQFWTMSINAGLAGTPTRFLATFDPVASPPQLVASTRDLPPTAVLEQFATSVEAMAAAVADLDAEQLATLAEAPPGHVAIRAVLLHALWDAWIHERDILLPLGRTQRVEDDEVTGCLAYVAALGPAFAVTTGSTREGSLVVDATGPAVALVVDVGTSIAVRLGDQPGAPRLQGAAAQLVEALSFRAPFPEPLPADDRWVVSGLDQVFDVA